MKLQKRIDKGNHTDVYVLYLPHEDLSQAFFTMSETQKLMIHDLQDTNSIADMLKMLEMWTRRIEEVRKGAYHSSTPAIEG